MKFLLSPMESIGSALVEPLRKAVTAIDPDGEAENENDLAIGTTAVLTAVVVGLVCVLLNVAGGKKARPYRRKARAYVKRKATGVRRYARRKYSTYRKRK